VEVIIWFISTLVVILYFRDSPFWVSVMFYISGSIFDNLSTIWYAKTFGLKRFFQIEASRIARVYVRKFGLWKGVFLSEFHRRRWLVIAQISSITILLYAFFVSGNLISWIIGGISIQLMSIGIMRFFASILNIATLCLELSIHPYARFKDNLGEK
jgi:hypothetical protein